MKNNNKNKKRITRKDLDFDPHYYYQKVKRNNKKTPLEHPNGGILNKESIDYIKSKDCKKITHTLDELNLQYICVPERCIRELLLNMDVMTRDEKISLFDNSYNRIFENNDIVFDIINDIDIINHIISNIYSFEYDLQQKIIRLINSPKFIHKELAQKITDNCINPNDMNKYLFIGLSKSHSNNLVRMEYIYSSIELSQNMFNYIMNNNELIPYVKEIISMMFNLFKPVYIGMMTSRVNDFIYNSVLELMETNLTSNQIEKILMEYFKYIKDNNIKPIYPPINNRFMRLNNILNEFHIKYGIKL